MMKFVKDALTALLLAALISACGGGVGSGGTGAPVGYASGTVTGFGSVIVDGTHFDDAHASVEVERGPNDIVNAEAKLGQQVVIGFGTDGSAKTIRVEAEAVGRVNAVSVPGALTMLGQTVTINTDANAGPVTVFDGYRTLADVHVDDVVEVHGLFKPGAAGGGVSIQATRIERRTVPPAFVRVVGVVSDLGMNGSGRVFRIGGLSVDYTAANIQPAGSALANGQTVVVFGQSVQADAGGRQTLVAQLVRIKPRENAGVDGYLGGVIGNLDAASASFELNGVRIGYAGAKIAPAGRTLANGAYAQVRGSFASDGSLTAAQIKIRNKQDEAESELKGTLTHYDAATQRFEVRGVVVDATGATLVSCPAGGLGNGLFVDVEGSVAGAGVRATRVTCGNEPGGGVVTRSGLAGSVDQNAKTFVLTPAGKPPVAVRWSATTFFAADLTPQTLNGQQLEVEGAFDGNVLVAGKIRRD